MFGDLFYRLGYTLGELGVGTRGKAGAAAPFPGGVSLAGEEREDESDEDDSARAAERALLGTAGAWLLARMLRPRPISWPRVMVSGVAATLLADVVGRAAQRRPGHALPYARDPQELMARLTAGVAVAAGYASIVYPRVPGSPLFRGLLFGALEIAAAPGGGLATLAREAPGVRFPLQALATPIDEDAGPASHLAFGLGLGLLYRFRPGREEEEDENDDDGYDVDEQD